VNKRKLILPVALAFGVIMLFLLLGGTVAYLTDAERGINIITIGNVHLELSEPSYTDNSKVLSAGDSVVKNPVLTNTGTKDEFVFIEVAVPKRDVTLLYEKETTVGEGAEAKTYKEGTPTVNNINATTGAIQTSSDEIYKIIADGIENGATAVNLTTAGELTDSNEPKTQPQLDFSYNKGSNTSSAEKEGWIYLSREVDKTVGTGDNALTYDYYYFGYNKSLLPKSTEENADQTGSVTIPLFDRIQLKSFIDEELNSAEPVNGVKPKNNEETKIIIKGYGIQADSLGIPNLDTDDFQDKEMLNKIFNIVKQKKG